MTPTVPTAALAPERGPAPRPQRGAGDHLRPVRQPGTRRSPAVPVLVGAGIVIAALFALAVMHALLIGGQLRLDDMQREVAAETEEIHRLRLRVAELESPDRVLQVARKRLGMVQPTEVGYLPPVEVDTGDAEPIRVTPAEIAPPEPVVTEQAADDDAAETEETDETDPGSDPEGTTDDASADEEIVGSSIESGDAEGGADGGTTAAEPVAEGGEG